MIAKKENYRNDENKRETKCLCVCVYVVSGCAEAIIGKSDRRREKKNKILSFFFNVSHSFFGYKEWINKLKQVSMSVGPYTLDIKKGG